VVKVVMELGMGKQGRRILTHLVSMRMGGLGLQYLSMELLEEQGKMVVEGVVDVVVEAYLYNYLMGEMGDI